MASEERITFSNPRGQRLVGILYEPDRSEAASAVILCHGMESSKESEKLVAMSRELATKGIAALRFDFACSGESEGKFEDITYSGEAEDLRAAFDFIAKRRPKKIGVLGSSMGGTVALLFAAQESKVAALVTIAAPLHPERFAEQLLTPDEARQWRETGSIPYHGRRLNVTLLEDLEKLDVPAAARKIACPTLVIHGDQDDTVSVEEGHELYAALAGPKKLGILPGADHRLSQPADLQKAMDESVNWLTQNLK
jgi:dipeptidyl aminopeptidase/acylaminoacyl peptidase